VLIGVDGIADFDGQRRRKHDALKIVMRSSDKEDKAAA
jgi:hypothetical protein